MKEIINRNSKGQHHGYQEGYYSNGNLWVKCFHNNGILVDYQEFYYTNGNLKTKTFHI